MNEIERVIEVAKGEVGYLEKKSNKDLDDKTANAGNGNYTKYSRDLDNVSGFYNGKKNGYAWCDIFVDWCFYKAFGVTRALELLCQPTKSLGAGVGFSAKYYKDKGQYYTSGPKPGDQIFLNKLAHTGLVIKVDGNYVYTIEGNTSNPVNCVKEKKYALNSTYIVGYGRPNYAEDIVEPTEPEKPVEPQKSLTDEELLRLVIDTINGKYGNDNERLEKLGKNYSIVQKQVNLNYQHGTLNDDNIRLY